MINFISIEVLSSFHNEMYASKYDELSEITPCTIELTSL